MTRTRNVHPDEASPEAVPPEAVRQLEGWLRDKTQAVRERDRSQRAIDGFDHFLEGWRLIHGDFPVELSQSMEASPPETADTVPTTTVSNTVVVVPTWSSVKAILRDVPPEDKAPTVKEIVARIEQRGWKLGSDSPERIVRKSLYTGQQRGEVTVETVDGRTNGYRLVPQKTPGDIALTMSPGPVPTMRVERGDALDTPAANTEDHNQTFDRRDDRDHHRFADDLETI